MQKKNVEDGKLENSVPTIKKNLEFLDSHASKLGEITTTLDGLAN